MALTRRQILGGLLAGAACPATAQPAPGASRPMPRGLRVSPYDTPGAREVISRYSLGGTVACVVADAETGQVLESVNPDVTLPPASTAKALTSLYAMDRLGVDRRFETRIVATGPLVDGRVRGDLILAGGGDPVLDTETLNGLAIELKAAGVREIAGNLKVWSGALPFIYEIDDEQPDHVAYNPAICGLNLNFNRVHFGWERTGGDYDVTMDARGVGVRPDVSLAEMRVVDRAGPVYTYTQDEDMDRWTVAKPMLGAAGSRWLPIRVPGLYAGEVFQTLLRAQGIMTAGPIRRSDTASGQVLVRRESAALEPLLGDMLRYSTNLTAEVMGLSATQSDGSEPETLADSAARMNAFLRRNYGMESVALEDHSGLGDDSRVSPADMVRAMVASGPDGRLRPLLKEFNMGRDAPVEVSAKTGTLNFVSALTGFAEPRGGGVLAFAILTGNLARRDALPVSQRERPPGGRAWANAARSLQRELLSRWGRVYAG